MKKKIFGGILVGALLIGTISLFARGYGQGYAGNSNVQGYNHHYCWNDCYRDYRNHTQPLERKNIRNSQRDNHYIYCDHHRKWENFRCPYNN